MKIRYLTMAFGIALFLSACSRRGDAVFERFKDLEASFLQNTNQWPLVHQGSGSGGGRARVDNTAFTFLILKKRVEAEQFRAAAEKLISDYIVARGGTVVSNRKTAGNGWASESPSQGADTTGQLILYRFNGYRGSITMRVVVFDKAKEAGHVYLEQASLK